MAQLIAWRMPHGHTCAANQHKNIFQGPEYHIILKCVTKMSKSRLSNHFRAQNQHKTCTYYLQPRGPGSVPSLVLIASHVWVWVISSEWSRVWKDDSSGCMLAVMVAECFWVATKDNDADLHRSPPVLDRSPQGRQSDFGTGHPKAPPSKVTWAV